MKWLEEVIRIENPLYNSVEIKYRRFHCGRPRVVIHLVQGLRDVDMIGKHIEFGDKTDNSAQTAGSRHQAKSVIIMWTLSALKRFMC